MRKILFNWLRHLFDISPFRFIPFWWKFFKLYRCFLSYRYFIIAKGFGRQIFFLFWFPEINLLIRLSLFINWLRRLDVVCHCKRNYLNL